MFGLASQGKGAGDFSKPHPVYSSGSWAPSKLASPVFCRSWWERCCRMGSLLWKVLSKLLCRIWGHVFIFLRVIFGNLSLSSFKISWWICLRISCSFHLTGKTAVLCFIKNGLQLLKIQPLQSFLWLITLADLSFCLSVCLSNYLSRLELILYQATEHFLFHLLYPVFELSFPDISL